MVPPSITGLRFAGGSIHYREHGKNLSLVPVAQWKEPHPHFWDHRHDDSSSTGKTAVSRNLRRVVGSIDSRGWGCSYRQGSSRRVRTGWGLRVKGHGEGTRSFWDAEDECRIYERQTFSLFSFPFCASMSLHSVLSTATDGLRTNHKFCRCQLPFLYLSTYHGWDFPSWWHQETGKALKTISSMSIKPVQFRKTTMVDIVDWLPNVLLYFPW